MNEEMQYDRPFFITSNELRSNIYLSKEILGPSVYYEVYETFRNCAQHQEVHLYLNSVGGNISTSLQIVSAMLDCDGPIVCHLDQEVCSAASLIAMFCDHWTVGPFASMMIHADTGGFFGKRHEAIANFEFTRSWLDEVISSCYSGFLTEKEIKQVLAGDDFYFGSSEIMERLERLMKHREKIAKKRVG